MFQRPGRWLYLAGMAACGFASSAFQPSVAAVALYTVGADASCSFSSLSLPNPLQSAIDAVPLNVPEGDLYVIRVARNATYASIPIYIQDRSLLLEGGYTSCDDPTPDSTNTVITGSGVLPAPVMTIHSDTVRKAVTLRRMEIHGGGSQTSGLNIRGVDVMLDQSTVTENHDALRGGGIYLTGTGLGASLQMFGNSSVVANSATQEGGGIYCERGAMLKLESDSAISNNDATMSGGGISINGCTGYINSGAFGLGGLFINVGFNSAGQGAGIALASSLGPTRITIGQGLTRTDPRPIILQNDAANQGGGIFAAGDDVRLDMHSGVVVGNTAVSIGGGIIARNGAIVSMTRELSSCDSDQPCLAIADNQASVGAGMAVAGVGSQLTASNTWIDGNTSSNGGSAVMALNDSGQAIIQNSVIVHNSGPSLFEASPGSALAPRAASVLVRSSTIVNNTTSSAIMRLNAEGNGQIHHSIMIDASAPVVSYVTARNQLDLSCSMLHESTSTAPIDARSTTSSNPGFVNGGSDDYHLTAAGWAVDRCPPQNSQLAFDYDLGPRPVNAPVGDAGGTYDMGAFEWNGRIFLDGFED